MIRCSAGAVCRPLKLFYGYIACEKNSLAEKSCIRARLQSCRKRGKSMGPLQAAEKGINLVTLVNFDDPLEQGFNDLRKAKMAQNRRNY
jgi:hypothetical protein